MQSFERTLRVGDAPRVVSGRDAVLGHEHGHSPAALPGAAHSHLERLGEELPAGQRGLHIVRHRARALGTDEGAGVGLHADEVVAGRLVEVPVVARVAVRGEHLVGARLSRGVEGLRGDGPSGLDTGHRVQDLRCAVVRLEQRVGDGEIGVREAVGDEVRRVLSPGQHRRDVRLVDRAHVVDAVEDRQHGLDVAGEQIHRVVGTPEAVLLEPLRHREVHERDRGVEPVLAGGVDHATVVVEHRPGDEAALGLDPRPLHREPVGVQPGGGEQPHVLRVAVEVVGGVTGGLHHGRAGRVFHRPPVARGVVALHLVGRCRGTPQEAVGECEHECSPLSLVLKS